MKTPVFSGSSTLRSSHQITSLLQAHSAKPAAVALAVIAAVLFGASPTMANTQKDAVSTALELGTAASYSPATTPSATNDITFLSATTYINAATLNISTTAPDIGTLNNLNTTALTISNTSTTSSRLLRVYGGSNGVSVANGGAANDLIFLATGADMTIRNGASRNLSLVLQSDGNINTVGNSVLTISSAILNSGGFYNLTKTGGGTLTLAGANSFGGGKVFTLNSGTLNVNSTTALGSGTTTFAINGGTLDSTATFTNQTLTSNQPITIGGNFGYTGSQNLNLGTGSVDLGGAVRTITANANTLTFGGTISNGGITKAGNGTLALSGTNTFSGNTLVSGGTLAVRNNLALQNSTIDTSGAGVIALSTATAPTFGGLTGSKNLASVITTGYGTVTAITLNPGSGVTRTYSGTIANGAAGMTLTKAGAGTQILSGVNSYTGQTTVSVGTLVVNGSIAASSGVSVSGGATLGGSGRVSAITGAGTIAPGNSAGILTATSATVGAGGESFKFELTTTGVPTWSDSAASLNDVLRLSSGSPITGTANSSNVFDIYLTGPAEGVLTPGSIYVGGIFTDNASDFASSLNAATYNFYVLDNTNGTVIYNGNKYIEMAPGGVTVSTIQIASADFAGGSPVLGGYSQQFTVVPEPGTCGMVLCGLGALVGLRRRLGRV